ncbi:hypothetical protein TKK_0004846 [Trichogramma kaykai]|uniref:Dynein intermediate chain 3, ciliary n=1 Tax=Trichogramma kaykai TaxID=54128 RepID=A0ABD2XLL6_9HYME
MTAPEYIYIKKRSEFGKRAYFSDRNEIEVDVRPQRELAHDFIRIDPASKYTQTEKIIALHEVNTTTATFQNRGMLHTEGGWPKDINKDDIEQTVRYRRKLEKDEFFVHTMLQLMTPMEHCVLQNNACNIYEQYFQDIEPRPLVQQTVSRTVNVYRDPLPTKRPVTHISWSPDGQRMAASHCSTDFKRAGSNYSTISYIWEVENPNKPWAKLKPFCPLLALEYNPKDSNILASGLTTGQVAFWDVRRGSELIEASSVEHSHRDPCDKLLWIASKTGTEFFSASKDGQIKWWDTRKLQAPIETIAMDLTQPDEQSLDRAIGVSSLQFEPSMGTRFMCGLENGWVISGNRKGKTPQEKLMVRFKAQYGPVISVERNPTFPKNFLTVGDWTARIWSEDCRESCILWTPSHDVLLTNGMWSPTRFSTFFLTKANGTLDVWDIIVQKDTPVLSIKVCDEPLTCLRPHEQGALVATGGKNGSVYLLEFSENLTVNQKNDKLLFTALLERETKREKVIEAKNRELRLKMKAVMTDPGDQEQAKRHSLADMKDPAVIQAEKDYYAAIEAERARLASFDKAQADNKEDDNNAERDG